MDISLKDRNRRRRMNSEMVQNVLLIWLDSNINANNSDSINTITQLRQIINTINTFTDVEQCFEFLNNLIGEKACTIISGALGQQIVPRIHNMSQVDSIFIFCGDENFHRQWAQNWSKIKGVFTNIVPICDALKVAAHQCEQNSTPISFMATTGDISKKNLNQLDASFMYTQILKEILLSIKFEEQHIMEFTEYCRQMFEDNENELNNIEQLEQQYREQSPIWWYTRDSFLYPMVNRALRVLDGDIIIKLGFFISDLHRDIDMLHKKQFDGQISTEALVLYRGQGMVKDDFNRMKEIKDGLLSFNCFLSTSQNREISLNFANEALTNPNLMGILFVMNVDHRQSTTPFASVAKVGYFEDLEQEVLFSMHAVFRIDKIKPIDESPRLYQVNLTLTSDNDKDLCLLTNRIREEVEGKTGWDKLGELLIKIGQPAKAQQVYETLLKQPSNELKKARFYHQLGVVKYYLGEYNEALRCFENASKIRQSLLLPLDPNVAKTHNWIGNTYREMGKYTEALLSHETALEIKIQSLPSLDPELAKSYNNIGNIYSDMGEYMNAISAHKKALEIRIQKLPPNHPDIARSYMNICNVYSDIDNHSEALSYYKKDLEIRQQSLPANHPDLAYSYNNIGTVYHNMGKYTEALTFHEKALKIRQQSLPSNHPDLASSYNNIGLGYNSIGQYTEALSSYEKAIEIRQQSLSSNHPDLAASYSNMGIVYHNMNNYSKARSLYEQAIHIGKQSLPDNHFDLKMYEKNLRIVTKKL